MPGSRDLPEQLARRGPPGGEQLRHGRRPARRVDPIGAGRHPLATPLDDGTWVVEIRTAPDAARAVLDAAAGRRAARRRPHLHLLEPWPRPGLVADGKGNRLWRALTAGDAVPYLERHGRPISYGYLDRVPARGLPDRLREQPGSAEMPSAGRPFTAELVARLVAAGSGIAPITLHTGVSSQEAGEAPQAEWFAVSPDDRGWSTARGPTAGGSSRSAPPPSERIESAIAAGGSPGPGGPTG